jgi:hypothetical protein
MAAATLTDRQRVGAASLRSRRVLAAADSAMVVAVVMAVVAAAGTLAAAGIADKPIGPALAEIAIVDAGDADQQDL